MVNVTDLIKSKTQFSFSIEVTPDVSEEELDMMDVEPAFFSVTWHAKSHKCKDMDIAPLRLASILREKQKNVVLHMSCDMMTVDYLKKLLVLLQEKNICNLFLVLGERYEPQLSDFENTSQLINFIRQQTGNYFCIGVAGFPDCTDEKLLYMKEKIKMGANYIITQAFFDINTYNNFIERCQKVNINVPIIPGVFPFESYKQLHGFINLCKIKVSSDLLEYIKNKETMNISCSEVVNFWIQQLNDKCHTNHFHFFTLNKLQRINQFKLLVPKKDI